MMLIKKFFFGLLFGGIQYFSCMTMDQHIRFAACEPEQLFNEIKEYVKKGYNHENISAILKQYHLTNKTALTAKIDSLGNTVLHASCKAGDFDSTKIILDACSDDEAKMLLFKTNKPGVVWGGYMSLHYAIDAIHLSNSNNHNFIYVFLEYVEKRFGRAMVEDLIVADDLQGSNFIKYVAISDDKKLMQYVLGFVTKTRDIVALMKKPNRLGTSALDTAFDERRTSALKEMFMCVKKRCDDNQEKAITLMIRDGYCAANDRTMLLESVL